MKYYFITGTSRGIGKALANTALSEGAKVFGLSRGNTIEHKNYEHIVLDLAIIDDVYKYSFPVLTDADKIILINNAGSLGDVAPVGQNPDEEITKLFNINTIASSILMNKFIKQYKELATEKLILNVSSGAGRHVVESWSAYCASKAAMDMYSMVAADEQKKYYKNPVHVFSVAPGIVDTQMQTEIRDLEKEKFNDVERFKDYKANGDLSQPEDIAKLLFQIILNPSKYSEVLLDVRNL